MSSRFLRKEGLGVIKKYADNGVLKSSQIMALWNADSHEEIISALSLLIELDNDKCSKIWLHVINNVWLGALDDDSRDTVFNQEENIFFKELLNNKGIITRSQAVNKVFKTPYICKEVVENLVDMKLIDCYQLRNWEVVYVLNLDFYQEVFRE